MSIRIMTAVWDVVLPASEKLVLLALADSANDEGGCWPSMATIAEKCSKSERTVQAAIKALVAAGHLSREERPGRGCFYVVKPFGFFTPAESAPPQKLRPAESAPPAKTRVHPRRICTQTVIEPSRTVIDDDERASADARPVGKGSTGPQLLSAVDVADQACRAAGVRNIEPAAIQRHVQVARSWLAEGFDLETDILPVIRETIAVATERITSLKYFDAPIRQAKAKREAQANGNGNRGSGGKAPQHSPKVRAGLAALGAGQDRQ